MMKSDFKQPTPIDRSETHFVSVYAAGLNNRDNNVREEMKHLNTLRPRQDDHNLHIISK